jgi:hypothetical protein
MVLAQNYSWELEPSSQTIDFLELLDVTLSEMPILMESVTRKRDLHIITYDVHVKPRVVTTLFRVGNAPNFIIY